MKSLYLSAVCLFAVAGAATAQVVTPPPKPAPETPEFIAPTPAPTAPRATPDPRRVNPSLNDASTRGPVPAHPYRSLEQIGEDGKIVRYDVVLDYEALRSNPLVGESKSIEMRPLVVGRRYRMESVVIDNFDLVDQVDRGLLDGLGLGDMAKMKQIIDTITPLVPPKSISQEMFDRSMLSPVQHRFNQKILGEYQNAILTELTAEDTTTGLSEFMKYMMHESLKEAMQAYEGLLGEAAWRMAQVLEHAGLSGTPQASKLLEISGSSEDGPEALLKNAKLVHEAWAGWDMSQKQAFMRAVQETRDDPHQPPVARVDLTNPDLIDQTGSGQIEVKPRQLNRGPKDSGSGG